ncbi:MAG: hypothetical protein QOH56_4217 [Pseudonocardiales bacterium]|nr:hypothetical protein [Pseudonocardiales bacterium]
MPLWRYPVRWLSLSALSDRWSYLSQAERSQRRAGWRRWRRAVRPIGLLIFWAGVLSSALVDSNTYSNEKLVLAVVWVAALLPFAIIGMTDWIRDGKAKDPSPATARAKQ